MEFVTKIIQNDVEPSCVRSDCFACEDEHCTILTNNDFGKRECPFYKKQDVRGKTQEA